MPPSLQLLYEEVLSHSSPLETIATKGSNMAEHYTTQQEVKQLQLRYDAIKDKAKVSTRNRCKGKCLQYFVHCRHFSTDWMTPKPCFVLLFFVFA